MHQDSKILFFFFCEFCHPRSLGHLLLGFPLPPPPPPPLSTTTATTPPRRSPYTYKNRLQKSTKLDVYKHKRFDPTRADLTPGYHVFSKVTYWFYIAHSLVLAFPPSCHAALGKEGPSSESVALGYRERERARRGPR